ncbi:hypothetical protein AA11237_3295 [Acidocella aminolytica 101 = DSM 11237]|nr:hypothetical protein AA11237_3295 [Acidocella aminolytica 101 = DSM 11237]
MLNGGDTGTELAVMSRLVALAAFGITLLFASPSGAAPCGNLPCNSPFFHAPYNSAKLLQTYKRVRAAYSPTEESWEVMEKVTGPLEGAGVQVLLTEDGGITPAQRIEILNDYGFWLYKQGRAFDAAAVLQVVVQLAPQRAVAWLNLGDAFVLELGKHDGAFNPNPNEIKLPPRLTWSDGQALTHQAIDAYRHYLALGGVPNEHVQDFLALNQRNAPQGNVCAFVTAYANAGRLDELGISGNGPINLTGDGRPYYVYSIINGTADVPGLLAFTTRQKDVEDDYIGQEGANTEIFSPLDAIDGIGGATQGTNPGDDLFLIAFKTRYYALDLNYSTANNAVYTAQGNILPTVSKKAIAAIMVVKPGQGIICTVTPTISPSLAKNLNVALCDQFLKGHPFDQPAQNTSLGGENITLGPRGLGADYDLTSTTRADIENNGHPVDLAYYDFESGAGAGCGQKGVVPFDAVARVEKAGPLDDALRGIRIDCDSGRDYVITWRGKTYIELDHGPNRKPGEARGVGIYKIKDDRVYPVCLIDNKFTYSIKHN